MSPLAGNGNVDQSLLTELLLSSADSITMGSAVFPATSLLAEDQQALQEVAALLSWEASSTDTVECISNGPDHLSVPAASVSAHHTERNSELAGGVAVGMEIFAGTSTQAGCTVQEMELPPLLLGMKAACGPCPVSLGRLQGSEHAVCTATEVGGRRKGTSDSVSLLPLPMQGENKIALACKDKWKVVGTFHNTSSYNTQLQGNYTFMVMTVCIYVIMLYIRIPLTKVL